MKNFKKVLALVLVLATLMGLATVAGAAYKDADQISADYTEAVKVLELIETMEGYPDGSFGPKKTITREEAAKLIAIFDNKDADIETYYTSINPFADEKGRWGESYVGYGFRAGIIGGRNATTFDPTANVTGTEFLKMALVTLGYDAEEEGFVGASWAVNVLSLARRLGLVDGLAKGWKAENDLTREEAAQILLNTLNTYTVEYGSAVKFALLKDLFENIKASDDYVYFNGKLYATVAGAVTTGEYLYEGFKLSVTESHDNFYRPQTKWTVKNGDSVKVMFPVKAQYTTKFSMCDLLVDLGIAKNNTDDVIYIENIYWNGEEVGNYTEDEADGVELKHGYSKCDLENQKLGAQGTLTQVFKMGETADGDPIYRICMIDTWLAKVGKVTKSVTARDEHLRSEGSVKFAEVYLANDYGDNTTCDGTIERTFDDIDIDTCDTLREIETLTYDDPTGLAKDDYVLITYSEYSGTVESVELATSKDGRLTGHISDAVATDPTSTRIDSEYVKDAAHFHLNYDLSKTNKYDTYTFFFDAYGNVIGMTDAEESSYWAVIDRAWTKVEDRGELALKADVVDMNAKSTNGSVKKVVVDITEQNPIEGFFKWANYDLAYSIAMELEDRTAGLSYKDFYGAYDHLVKVTTDSEGKFTVTATDKVLYVNEDNNTYKLTKNKPYLEVNGKQVEELTLTSSTQILVHKMDGSYVSYTGYKNVDSLIAHYAEVVLDEDNNIEVLYLCDDVWMTEDTFVAYVGSPATDRTEEKNDETYYGLKVYVDGVETIVYLSENDADDFKAGFTKGFYEFQTTDIDGVPTAKVLSVPSDMGDYMRTAKTLKKFTADFVQVRSGSGDIEHYNIAADCAFYFINDGKTKVVEKVDVETMLDAYEYEENVEPNAYINVNADDEVDALYLVLAGTY